MSRGTQISFGHFGTDISTARTAREALELAGLNWAVQTVPALANVNGQLIKVPDSKVIVRSDTNEPLGMVGNRFQTFQNEQAFGLMDEFLRRGGQMIRGGAFAGGSGTFMSMKLDGGIKIGSRDAVEKYLTFVNTHDGSMTYKAIITPFRLFCSNQIRKAVKKGDSVSIRHTKSGEVKLEEADRTLKLAAKFYEDFDLLANKLYATKYSHKNMVELATKLFPSKQVEEDAEVVEEVTTRTENNREKLVSLMEDGMGHRETGIAGTAWGAVNAVAEFVDHHRTTRGAGENAVAKANSRTVSAWFGSGADFKAEGFNIVLAQTGLA